MNVRGIHRPAGVHDRFVGGMCRVFKQRCFSTREVQYIPREAKIRVNSDWSMPDGFLVD